MTADDGLSPFCLINCCRQESIIIGVNDPTEANTTPIAFARVGFKSGAIYDRDLGSKK